MEAVVEARQIDHRLNVLSDSAKEKDGYREDAFARYLTGLLYESTGDLNNAFIAYRKAFEIYEATKGWARTPMPPMLREDLLRTTNALHMTTEFEEYRRQFPETHWVPREEQPNLAQVVVIGYNGRAPRKEEAFLDIPISLSALQLVLLNRGVIHASNRQERRAADSVLYGLNGRVVRVALPQLVPQKTQVMHEAVTLVPREGAPISARSELVYNGTALAERSLSDRMPGITTKALARAIGTKSVVPCTPEVAHRHSGYLVGGTSPFGLRKAMPVYMEASILNLPLIYLNGGKRGFLVSLAPSEVQRLLQPTLVNVAVED
jgi:hypothetical protein